MNVEVSLPVEFQGAVMGIISKRNGIVAGSEGKEGWVTLDAEVISSPNSRQIFFKFN